MVRVLGAVCRENVFEFAEGLPCPMPVDQAREAIASPSRTDVAAYFEYGEI